MTMGVLNTIRDTLKNRNIFVDLLCVLFGMCSWIGVSSVYLQLPLIVSTAPEGWELPSVLVVTIQLANIGSFAYVLYQKYSLKKIPDDILIYIALTIGCVGAIGIALFYQVTIGSHSVALLFFSFLLSLVGCVSMVLFMPYMGRFRECYLVSYMLGMSLNGFLSSCLALIQGANGKTQCKSEVLSDGTTKLTKNIPPPLFSTTIFFILVFMIMLIGTIAFILLNKLSVCKREYARGTFGSGNEYQYEENDENPEEHRENIPADVRNLSTFNYWFLILAIVSLNVLANGVFPAIITYVGLPYGNQTYHLCVTLAAIGSPIAALSAAFLPHTSILVNKILCSTQATLGVYIFYIATQSPSPPLKESTIGSILIISSWTIFNSTISYMKTSIVSIFRYQQGRTLVWVGAFIQIGSIIGAIISYILIQHTSLFNSAPEPC